MKKPVSPNVIRTIERYNARVRAGEVPGPDRGGWGLKKRVNMVKAAQPQTKALVQEILDVLRGDGFDHIRSADRVAVELLAVTLRRIRQCEVILDERGLTDQQGNVRSVATLLTQLLRQAREHCDGLGMTPLGRSKLGLNVASAATNFAEYLAALRTQEQGDKDGAT